LSQDPPDYENYDYTREWTGMRLNDLAEKQLLRSWILPAKGGTCLELGCGFGRLTVLLEGYFSSVVGIDFSNRNLHRTLGNSSNQTVGLIRSDIHNLPSQGDCFDFVVMVRVAHHLSDPTVVMDEICRVARDRATVIISLPNPLLSKKGRKETRSVQVYTGGFGHKIYSTPFAAYSHGSFNLIERRGTGLFENKVAKLFGNLPQLHLVDVASSSLWFLKKNIFLKFEIRK
jgi:ubiquinone/menaquinone biosynthesis C-methylase UbiE